MNEKQSHPATASLQQLREKLRELFMFDQADLDFGIYRIMNAKRDEIMRFLDDDLLPQVRQSLADLESGDRAEIETNLARAVEQAKELGVDAETSTKVKQLQEQLAATTDVDAIESEVFSHLYEFFRRYYSDGDYLSLRRYKAGVYAIPYEGEDVKLHWANSDQYYIKTTENFRDYAFNLSDGRRVHFRVVGADSQANNNKATNGNERRFILEKATPLMEQGGELIINFEYRPDAEKRKQAQLNTEAVVSILSTEGFMNWVSALGIKAPTEKNKDRTVLEKHLSDYTGKNTFDYFIHKDLGGFLRRELDFYIKNEVMFLDDIELDTAPHVERYLAKVKAIRRIAHKLIDFLKQLEEFQRKLWLKKKFVIETRYLIRLDQIPEEFYPEIAANEMQHEDWVRVCAIKDCVATLETSEYTNPLTVEFLKTHQALMVDTRHFSPDFVLRILATVETLDDRTDGLLIHSENFQALSLIQARYKDKIRFVYIDPPYNTDASPIIYKNGYRRSSWASLMKDRLKLDMRLRVETSMRCVAIDDFEYPDLRGVLESLPEEVHIATAVVRSKPQGRPTASGFSANHEYAVFWGSIDTKIGRLPRAGSKALRYSYSDEKGIYAWSNFRKSGTDSNREDRRKSFYPLYVVDDAVRIPEMTWDEIEESWQITEAPLSEEQVIWPIDADKAEKVWTCSPARARDEIEDIRVQRDGEGHVEIQKKYRPNQEGALPGTWWAESSYSASESGTKVLKDMFGARDFDYPKSIHLVADCLRVGGVKDSDYVLDYFAGSGTTGHAVINLNRDDGGQRKFILIEIGDYFDTVLVPRMTKVTFAPEWKDGKPLRTVMRQYNQGPRILKIVRIESYEDSLNNLVITRTSAQSTLLDDHDQLREDYKLRYMLDVEALCSASLLNIEQFADPFSYKLNVSDGGSVGATRQLNVDLVETFNYLIGLRVNHIDSTGGFRVIEGTVPNGEKVLIIWRNIAKKTNADLDQFFQKQAYKTGDNEFDLIYVNGDNNLENLRRTDETWKVRLIEQEFHRLMFDVRDV